MPLHVHLIFNAHVLFVTFWCLEMKGAGHPVQTSRLLALPRAHHKAIKMPSFICIPPLPLAGALRSALEKTFDSVTIKILVSVWEIGWGRLSL
jgi:hypothetical protein